MAKTRTIAVEGFGLLTHRVADLWERPLELDFLGRRWTVPMLVDISKRGGNPEPTQLEAYKSFVRRTQTIVRSVEAAIAKHYASIKGVPNADARREVSRAVRLEGVSFPYARGTPTFGFLCKCDWDEEHGLAVKFEDGQLTEVGPQDILL